MGSIRVLIVDENEFLRMGLASCLNVEDDIEVIGNFGSADEAIAKVNQLRPNVALVGLDLPDANGLATCRLILSNTPAVRVILLASKVSNSAVSDAMMADAAGILPSNFSTSDLLSTVRANGKGALYLIPPVAELSLEVFRGARKGSSLSRLTERENRVLAEIPHGLSNAEIGAKLGISQHTVRNYVSRILIKLNLSRRTELAAHAGIIRVMNANHVD